MGAALVAVLVVAGSLPAHAQQGAARGEAPAPLAAGRWTVVPSDKPPTPAQLAELCAKPFAYTDVSATEWRDDGPNTTKSVCAAPVFKQVGRTKFMGKFTKCTPKVEPGEGGVSVEVKGPGLALINNALVARCP